MKTSITLLTVGLSAMSSISQAKKMTSIEDCEHQTNDNIALSSCLDEVGHLVDKELTTWVNNQLFILEEFAQATGRKSALRHFKTSQKQFEQFRESNCKWQFLVLSPATSAATVYKKCYIRWNKARIEELNLLTK